MNLGGSNISNIPLNSSFPWAQTPGWGFRELKFLWVLFPPFVTCAFPFPGNEQQSHVLWALRLPGFIITYLLFIFYYPPLCIFPSQTFTWTFSTIIYSRENAALFIQVLLCTGKKKEKKKENNFPSWSCGFITENRAFDLFHFPSQQLPGM